MEILLLVVGVTAVLGFFVGFSKALSSANPKPDERPTAGQVSFAVFVGLMCAVGGVLLLAALGFGACMCGGMRV